MKKIKLWSMLMFAIMTLSFILSCGSDDNDDGNVANTFSIVGTWRHYFVSNDPSRGRVYDQVTFNSDHTGFLIEEVGYGSDRPNPLIWSLSDNIINIRFTEEDFAATWTMVEIIDNNTVVINDGRKQYTVYRETGDNRNDNTTTNDTINNPMSVNVIYSIVATMEADEISFFNFCAKGKICSIKYPFNAEYGTAVFDISDNGATGGEVFTVYNTYYKALGRKWMEGNPQVNVGDDVIVYGKVMNYRGTTPEFADKQSYIVSLNGR